MTKEKLDILSMASQSLFGKVTVKNVLESHIWLIGIFVFFIVIMGIFHVDLLIIGGVFLLLLILVGHYMYSHNFFMRNKPDYLRSETFQLQKQQQEMLGEKGKEIPDVVIAEQPLKQLPKSSKRK